MRTHQANQPIKRIIFSILLTILMAGPGFFEKSLAQEGPIPEDRMIDWAPGLGSSIPFYPVFVSVKDDPYGAAGDGVTDDTEAIRNALADCPNNKAVYFPQGVYRITGELSVRSKSIALRGAGPLKTRIVSYGTSGAIIRLYAWSSSAKAYISESASKGSRSLVFSDSTTVKTNEYVLIDQENDPETTFDLPSYQGRAIGQINTVSNISGNTISLSRPLYTDFKDTQDIQLSAMRVIYKAGVEDLSVERAVAAGDDNINFTFAANCWIKNVMSIKANRWHVRIRQSFRCEVRDSFFVDGHTFGGDHAYGVGCFQKSTDNLIINNAFSGLRHSMILEYGGCGNVYAYNVSRFPKDSESGTDWLMSDMAIHGGNPFMNLFEGNVASHIDADNYLGSSAYNTFFRNFITRKGEDSVKWGRYAVEIQMNNLYANVIGNVLGERDDYDEDVWRIGFDRLTSTVDGRVEDTLLALKNYNNTARRLEGSTSISLPESLFLSSKPDFFTSGYNWPPINPDSPTASAPSLPAMKWFTPQNFETLPPTQLQATKPE